MGTAKLVEYEHEVEPERERERERERETSSWIQAHRELSRLAQERVAADAEEGRWLLAALRSAAHLHLGFGSFSEYIERSFGYKPRTTQEKLRVAEALEDLPVLTQALEQGTLHWSAARELTRVAFPENEREWLTVAHGKSVRQLEELVAGKGPGDDPSSPSRASERRRVLRFEVAPETFALFREALTALRRSADGAFGDDEALLALARLALGGPCDEGRASYQIAVTVCAECSRGHQLASGELVPIGADIVEMAHCDAQDIGRVTPHAANDGNTAPTGSTGSNDRAHLGRVTLHAANDGTAVGSAAPSNSAHVGRVTLSIANDGTAVGATAPSNSAHVGRVTLSIANDGTAVGATAPMGSPAPSNSAHVPRVTPHAANDSAAMGSTAPSSGAHVGAEGQVDAVPGADVAKHSLGATVLARAKQTIPPALRRAVLLRDQRCCRVPGCRNSAYIDVHHIQLRAEGGRNEAENLITLCGAHHRAAHRGRLTIDGTATTVSFRHADGSPYGRVLEPQALEARAKTFSALRNLGFCEGDVRTALAQLDRTGELAAGTIEQWIRAALARLYPPRSRR